MSVSIPITHLPYILNTLSNKVSVNVIKHLHVLLFLLKKTVSQSSLSYSKIKLALFTRMANSYENNFPPQKQDTQPGKEYLMNPPPQYNSSQYKPSNKLQVYITLYLIINYLSLSIYKYIFYISFSI